MTTTHNFIVVAVERLHRGVVAVILKGGDSWRGGYWLGKRLKEDKCAETCQYHRLQAPTWLQRRPIPIRYATVTEAPSVLRRARSAELACRAGGHWQADKESWPGR